MLNAHHGAQDIQIGNPILDPMVMIKAKDTTKATQILQKSGVQQALIDLFQFSHRFDVSDAGIEHYTKGSFVDTQTLKELMQRMITANRSLATIANESP